MLFCIFLECICIIFFKCLILFLLFPVKDSLMSPVSPPVMTSGSKVTVVGVGQVGMACAFSILTQVNINIIFYNPKIISNQQGRVFA